MSTRIKKTARPLIIANWKMNPVTVGAAKKLFVEVRSALRKKKPLAEVVVAAPMPYLSELQRLSPSQSIGLAAQDAFSEKSGAYTGEVSLPMLASVGVTTVIIGHSERRSLGDTDASVAALTAAVAQAGMTAVVCVGEQKRDKHGQYFTFVEQQLTAALAHVPKTKLKHVVVAYEPIWAIGTGAHATAEDVAEMKLFIEKVLSDTLGRTPAGLIRVLYGGSVKADNAAELSATGISGFLVGGASLKSKDFVEIVHHASAYAQR